MNAECKNLTSICGRKQMRASTPQETTDISGEDNL